ncbi:hypothetical protein FF38_05148, partial [Lucilia cuprina]
SFSAKRLSASFISGTTEQARISWLTRAAEEGERSPSAPPPHPTSTSSARLSAAPHASREGERRPTEHDHQRAQRTPPPGLFAARMGECCARVGDSRCRRRRGGRRVGRRRLRCSHDEGGGGRLRVHRACRGGVDAHGQGVPEVRVSNQVLLLGGSVDRVTVAQPLVRDGGRGRRPGAGARGQGLTRTRRPGDRDGSGCERAL